MNSGRSRRGRIASATCARVSSQRGAPVAVSTMSVVVNSAVISSHGTAAPSTLAARTAARAALRLAIPIRPRFWERRCVAVSSAISPAPTTSARRPARSPNILRASEIAA